MQVKEVNIPLGQISLSGMLAIPSDAKGIIIFVHGSGSSRKSPRNMFVASELQKNNFATLLFDLLTEEEDTVYKTRFNIELLTRRLQDVTFWIKKKNETKLLNVGYFGASTGAAAALVASVNKELNIQAVVSRGGRPDLARQYLTQVKAPTLLIVGGYDDVVIKLNEDAFNLIHATKDLKIVPGASHLFEESGKLEEVSKLATTWFKKWCHG